MDHVFPSTAYRNDFGQRLYGESVMVNFSIYKSGEETICIDSGLRKAGTIKEPKGLKIDLRGVTHLFLIHSDYDHARGVNTFPGAKIYLSMDEEHFAGKGNLFV